MEGNFIVNSATKEILVELANLPEFQILGGGLNVQNVEAAESRSTVRNKSSRRS